MPRQSEIDRMLVLLYRSNNPQGYTNFTRPIDWLDKLPMVGLMELSSLLSHMKSDVEHEIDKRKADGMPKFSREWYEGQQAEQKAGAALLSQIGVNTSRKDRP